MSFPKYPKYKDSGVEWLGEVPEHWEVTKMKWVAKMESGHTPDKKVPDYWENGEIPWVSLNDTGYLKDNDYISDTAYAVTDRGIANSSARLLPPRSVVFSRDATIGRCAITTRPMACSQHFIAWVCGKSMIPEYLLLRLRSMTRELDRLTTGATLKTIGMPDVRTLVTPVPPMEEQHAIINWVSIETSKIDELVAEQRRLIELLKEKRQAVISHAVTKGLNPNVPMKPSGIEWLGDVPEHWEIKSFQRCVSIAEGQVDPKTPGFSEMVLIAPNHVESGTGKLYDLEAAGDQGAISGKYFCRSGDVLYSKIRPALRKACLAPHDCLCSADMYPLHAHSGMTNEFLFRWILTEQFSAFAVLESDRVAMPKINRESLKEVRFALPPIEEQHQICAFITTQAVQFDELTAEAENAIELLQERRTALISAAVTGKIDVRNFAPQVSEVA